MDSMHQLTGEAGEGWENRNQKGHKMREFITDKYSRQSTCSDMHFVDLLLMERGDGESDVLITRNIKKINLFNVF